jgi:hypothetical protein
MDRNNEDEWLSGLRHSDGRVRWSRPMSDEDEDCMICLAMENTKVIEDSRKQGISFISRLL